MTKGEATRHRIERAALRLFAEKGVEQATIKHIAAGAGITEGAIYRHFESKDALLRDLFAGNYRRLALELAAVRDEAPDLRARIAAMVGFFCRQYEADPHMFRFLLLTQHDQLRHYAPDAPSPVQVVCDTIAAAVRADEIPAQDPNVATAILFGMVTQPAVFKIYGRIDAPMTDLSDGLAAACWRAIAAAGEWQ